MGALYLYAITDRPAAALAAGRGLEEAPLVAVRYRDLGAVTGALGGTGAPAASPANVRRHESVLQALMVTRTVLPVRFGTLLPDAERTREVLREHYRSFAETLARVRGRVELGLRVLWTADGVPLAAAQPPVSERSAPTVSGRTYLLARLEEEHRSQAVQRQAETIAAEIHGPLAAIAADSTRQTLPTPQTLLVAAYLVDRDNVVRFEGAVRAVARVFTGCRFLLTGPWSPYSFVTGYLEDGLAVK